MVKETEAVLEKELKEALARAEKKADKKSQHIESLVRMIFAQKSERFIITEEERESVYQSLIESLDLSDKEKEDFKDCNKRIREYRQRKQDAKLIKHPRSQGVTWKSPYSEELRSQILTEKYVFHIPANRQIKRFKMDGLEMAASTMDDIIESTCDIIEPLYKLQYQRVMKAILLAADGSPIPVLDNEKHKTVKQYIIEYRSIDTDTIMYSLFGACKLLGKNPEHWLTYVLKHIDTTPKEELHKLLPEEWEEA